jgi:GxxExxY protein
MHVPGTHALPIKCKDLCLDCGYHPDLVVDKLVIVEFKAVEKVEAIHEAQLLTYLRLTKLWLGLLINFSVRILKAVIKRLVNGYFVFFASLW